jgi:hypothetical protein
MNMAINKLQIGLIFSAFFICLGLLDASDQKVKLAPNIKLAPNSGLELKYIYLAYILANKHAKAKPDLVIDWRLIECSAFRPIIGLPRKLDVSLPYSPTKFIKPLATRQPRLSKLRSEIDQALSLATILEQDVQQDNQRADYFVVPQLDLEFIASLQEPLATGHLAWSVRTILNKRKSWFSGK